MLNFGGFLSSNFWTNYRCQSSASVEDLLSSPECTVDKLLDDDDCLQEFKNYNDKLIKYFDHDKLKVLVDYITVMPEVDEQKRGHKYPFLAAEIFNCEINQVLDKFFEAPVKVKPQPAIAADSATDSSVTKDGEEEEKKEGAEEKADDDTEKKDEAKEDAATEEKKDGEKPSDDKEETKAEKSPEKEEGATNLEEVVDADKKEEKPASEETKKEEPVADAKPPQDGEAKEEAKEETKVASPEKKQETEPTKAKEVSPEKNT